MLEMIDLDQQLSKEQYQQVFRGLQLELLAFAGAPGGVQFQHESDTSIDNNDV